MICRGLVKSENEIPVICRGLVKSDNDYSAFVQVGFGINSNTHFKKQAYAFLKFALSEDVQTKMCGAKRNFIFCKHIFSGQQKRHLNRQNIV
ncbi:hypothetical protein DWX71_10635, partial [Ruminococcus bromii]